MHKVWMIVRREYFQAVKQKAFWIGTALFPVFVIGIFAIQIVASLASPERQKPFAVIDQHGAIAPALIEELDERMSDGELKFPMELLEGDVEEARTAALDRVESGDLYGLISIGPELKGQADIKLEWKNFGDQDTKRTLRWALQQAVELARFEESALEIDKTRLEELTASISLETFQVTKDGDTKKRDIEDAILPTFVFVMMLYMLIYFHGYAVTRGIVAEKSTRVMEVLLGSVTPDQLMTGKILGIGLVGLTQVGIYTISGIAVRAAANFWFSMGDMVHMLDAIAVDKLLAFAGFYMFGFFVFVGLFAIVGAACNNDMEAQQLQIPIVLCLMLPMMTTFFFVANPDSLPATIASLIPIFTPMVMFMRVNVLTPPMWQILLSFVLMGLTIYIFFRAAAKVFRIGTLMYGKRPTVKEILRWART